MLNYGLAALGIICSALAQIMLKKGGTYNFKELSFFIYFGAAVFFYVLAMLLYFYILKFFPLNKISPATSIAAMILIVIAGSVIFHEQIGLQQTAGIILGAISIILIMG
jgi:drug/metabolite transporter (DMT)-like permease